MHYAQSSVYSMVGMNWVLAPYQSGGDMEFGYTTLDVMNNEPTDILKKFGR